MMRRILLSGLLGLALGALALVPMFISAVGHDSRSVFVGLANSVFLEWPFLLAARIVPASASGNLGTAIHFAFYTLIAWTLLSSGGTRRGRTPGVGGGP